jgi:predicted dehydrogenase
MEESIEQLSDTVSLGIVGCGYAGLTHLSAISETDRAVRVRALCDVEADAREQARDTARRADVLSSDASVTATDAEMPYDDLDGVIVSTPPKYHTEQIRRALRNDVNVLVEKPMVVSKEEVTQVREALDESDATLWVNYQKREKPRYRAAKRLIREGRLGRVENVSVTRVKHSRGLHEDGWRSDPDVAGGGQLFDLGNHMLDLVFWLVDDLPAEYESVLSTHADLDAEAYANVVGRLDDGVPFSLSLHAHGYPSVETIHVSGSDASLRITKQGVTVYESDQPEPVPVDDGLVCEPVEILLSAISDGESVEPDFDRWAASVEMTQDIYANADGA